MRALNDREKRTIRIAGVLLVLYLVVFYGIDGLNALEAKRDEYRQLGIEAENLNGEVLAELKKRRRLQKLRNVWKVDLEKLDPQTVVSEVRDAIQKAAGQCGVGLGASQEVGRRASAKELQVVQIKGAGTTDGVMKFLYRLRTLGYPLAVDRLQLKPVAGKPGQMTVSMSVAILNFTPWTE